MSDAYTPPDTPLDVVHEDHEILLLDLSLIHI